MPTLNVVELVRFPIESGQPVPAVGGVLRSSDVATSASSAELALLESTRFVRLSGDAVHRVRIGSGAQTAVTGDLRVAAGESVLLEVPLAARQAGDARLAVVTGT